ncbi:ubiquitin carboxyl-terminal hydrolase 22 [Nilaparvata lugens]|uniref:ubiquitin carboxyl-terminal hydrolase 22 n=1 Tax=Nilaparvata lugens TaxID=108931 RepID=UPI00193D43A9|nr:ubiquitin carboxyl-terminal hydrolase 22 [Nilaparvata lugens]
MSENGCIHLDNFKSKHGLQSYITIYSYFVASTTSEARKIKAKCCFCYVCKAFETRLHSCLTCIFFGCHKKNHIQEHAKMEKHYLAIELMFGNVLCVACGDYVYDSEMTRVADERHLKAMTLAGLRSTPFRHWWPSPHDVHLLKQNPCRRMLLNNTTIGLRGLVNLGNSCYVNSIVQVLTHIPPLRDYFLSERHTCRLNETPETCFVCEISRIFQEFYSGNKSPLILKHLLVLVWANIKHMACNKQQDAHEFLMIMLNYLHEQSAPLNPSPPPASSSPPPGAEREERGEESRPSEPQQQQLNTSNSCSCIIDLIFTGKLQSDITCHVCNGVSTTIDPFWDISLELDNTGRGGGEMTSSQQLSDTAVSQQSQSSSSSSSSGSATAAHALKSDGDGTGSGSVSLDECLEQFTRAEHLGSIRCNNCDADQQQTKQLTVQKLPVVVCFHLKRFEAICTNVFAKISKIITFPLELDMSPFMSHRRNSNQNHSSPSTSSSSSASSYTNYCTQILEDNRYSHHHSSFACL